MFENLYPATARAAKAYMAEHVGLEASPLAAAVDSREPSASTAAGEVRTVRLTIDIPEEGASEVVIHIRHCGPALTLTFDLDGGAARPSRPEGAP